MANASQDQLFRPGRQAKWPILTGSISLFTMHGRRIRSTYLNGGRQRACRVSAAGLALILIFMLFRLVW